MSRLAWIAFAAAIAMGAAWFGGWRPAPDPAPVAEALPPAAEPPRAEAPHGAQAPRTAAAEPPRPAPPEPRTGQAAPAATPGPAPAPGPTPGPAATPPATTRAAEAARPRPPRFDVARLGRNGMLVTAGRAAPGSEVTLLEDGREIGRGRADARGEWVILPDGALRPGPRELTLVMRLPGGEPVSSEASVLLLVPEPAMAAAPTPGTAAAEAQPQEQAPARQSQPAPLALLLPQAQAAPVLALQAPAGTRLALDVVDYGTEGDLRLAGSAPPGAALRFYVEDRHMGDAQADSAGRWSLSPGEGLPPGQYRLRVDQLNAQGRVAARIEQPFVREAPPVIAAALAAAGGARHVVQPGNTLWRIARASYGRGARFTLIFAANREQIRDPNRIYPGQVFALPAPADSSLSR